MADDIKKFLQDAAAYPDSTPIKIGDTEVPLGSLRALNATERTQLSDKLKELETKEQEIEKRRTSVVDLADRAQKAYEAAEEARKATAAGARTPSDDPLNDPWLAPVKKEFEGRDKKLEDLAAQIKQALNLVGNVATIWTEDRYDREYAALDFGKRDKKPARDELLKFAKDNNLTDRHKIPSLSAAWEKMSAAERIEDAREKARLEGIEEGKRQAMAARVTPPGSSGPGSGAIPTPPKGPVGDLGDLYSEAMKDSELRQILEQAETHGIM